MSPKGKPQFTKTDVQRSLGQARIQLDAAAERETALTDRVAEERAGMVVQQLRADDAEERETSLREENVMRLAAISTASIQNTRKSLLDRISPEHPYYSTAYGDTCRAVEREIRERERAEAAESALAAVTRERNTAQESVQEWRGKVTALSEENDRLTAAEAIWGRTIERLTGELAEVREAAAGYKIAVRPWLDGAAGLPGTVTFLEWSAALERLDAAISVKTCHNCGHPQSWHRHDDADSHDPSDPDCPFRCLGYDCDGPGFPAGTPESRCGCPDFATPPQGAK